MGLLHKVQIDMFFKITAKILDLGVFIKKWNGLCDIPRVLDICVGKLKSLNFWLKVWISGWKFWISLHLGIFWENFKNNLKLWKITSYHFLSMRQILTPGGVNLCLKTKREKIISKWIDYMLFKNLHFQATSSWVPLPENEVAGPRPMRGCGTH